MSNSNTSSVNGSRLWGRLMAMGEIGATEAGGCNRQALTDEDKVGRELFIDWCRLAGCDIRIDAIGNIFARRAGKDDSLAAVITGSHLDTQPTGGKFDGIYGVLAGLEVIEALNDHGVDTEHPIEVVAWTNEEGCRFDTAMMGSAVWSGAQPIDAAYQLTSPEGDTVEGELKRIGFLGSDVVPVSGVKAAFEAHIEQGPVLEAKDKVIGVVTGVQHMSRHRIFIDGQEAHAGPTPMELRKDPVRALSGLLPGLYDLADEFAPHGRMTIGYLDASPGSSNTVPGKLALTVDLRHPDQSSYSEMRQRLSNLVKIACIGQGLTYDIDCFWEASGVEFDEQCVNAVREAVGLFDYSSMELFSGAGHDACNVAGVVPTSMIFIPCKEGLSHNEAEYASPAHVEAGANILLHAMLKTAN